jgi:hypothetical protein
MSSYIPKQPKRERDQISIKLDRDVLRRLEHYGRFLESSRDYIINSVLKLDFRKDKSFSAWLETDEESGEAEGSTATADRLVDVLLVALHLCGATTAGRRRQQAPFIPGPSVPPIAVLGRRRAAHFKEARARRASAMAHDI